MELILDKQFLEDLRFGRNRILECCSVSSDFWTRYGVTRSSGRENQSR
jgi:hypothetical protein